MGFYAPNTVLQDAKRHEVKVLPVNVMKSRWDSTLERDASGALAVRLGVGLVRGLGPAHQADYERGMDGDPPKTLREFARRTKLPQVALERLAVIGALRAFVPARRDAVWKVQALSLDEAGLLTDVEAPEEPGAAPLPAMDQTERLAADFSVLGLSIESHPIALWRGQLKKQQVLRCSEVNRCPHGAKVKVAGLAIVTQRPGTAKGMVFITLEDETGLVNAVLTPAVWAAYREARDEVLLVCDGKVEREDDVVNLMVTRVQRLAPRREAAGAQTRQFR